MTSYNERITKASEQDPLWVLAVQLHSEGVTDTNLPDRLAQEEGKFCPEQAKIRVRNYLRDIERGATRPLRKLI